jgi:excisionase family DNA binding protein
MKGKNIAPNEYRPEVLQFTVSQTALLLNLSEKTVYRLIERRKLRVCNLLRKKMIPRSDVLNFSENNSGYE